MDSMMAIEDMAKPEPDQTTAAAAVASSDPVEDNKFQKAIAVWRNIDLTSLISGADGTASDIVTQQRDALEQRKDLAQKTRDFRKLDDAGKLTEYKGLLKAYQSFIDVITTQSKTVQTAFFQVYSPLSEAPDPYPLLEASIESLVTADETLPKLAGENEHLQSSIANLSQQLEETEKRLENERAARQDLEKRRDGKIQEVEASWSAVIKEKQDNWESKEKSFEERAENQDRLLKELKASYEVSQRLGRGDEDAAVHSGATAAELEIVSSELDRANTRLAEVEARNEQLRLELAQSASNSNKAQVVVEEEPAFLRLQSENSSLIRRLDSTRFAADAEKRRWEAATKALERDVAALRADRDSLREKVHKWSDYDSIKSELEVLKTIEFATGDDDDMVEDEALVAQAAKDGSTSGSKKESLEQLLLARNKKLSNELTILRVSHNDLQKRLETLQEENSATNMELEKCRRLAATLENDLVNVQKEAANAFDPSARSVAGTYTSRYPMSSLRRGGRSSPTSSIISGFDPSHASAPTTLESLRAGEAVGGGSGILPMVTAQRDRFKKKNSELEAELQKQYQAVSSLRSEIASLQKDNLSLYEKTRYVSTYNRGGGHDGSATSSSAYAANASASSIMIGSAGVGSPINADARYQSAYESHISPFVRFRGRESARAMKRMSLAERFVFQITRMVLATRASRNLFAAYCLALHLLVFVMLYWMGSVDIASGMTSLSEHVEVVGKGAVGGVADNTAGGIDAAGQWHEEAPPRGG